MKKVSFILLVCAAVSCGAFYAGFKRGEFNGRLERSARDTGPLMNLLLVRAGMEKELIEMNREQLYYGVHVYDALSRSWLVTRPNRALLQDRILVAKDYWEAFGGKILQTEDEKRKTRESIEAIQASAGIPVTMIMDGVKVSPLLFEEKDQRIAVLFDRYSDQKSSLHDFIHGMVNQAENRPNQSPEPTRMLVTICADAQLAPSTRVAHL